MGRSLNRYALLLALLLAPVVAFAGGITKPVQPANAVFDFLVINRVNIVMECATAPTDKEFCDIAALTNGLKIEVIDTDGSTVLLDFLAGTTIKENRDLVLLAGPDVVSDFANANNRHVFIRWTIARAFDGEPLLLSDNQHIQITVQDNISTVTEIWAMVQGYKL
jgi:hypothetical protein